MSENKPNDDPKLSTTDRVVKCKCLLFVYDRKIVILSFSSHML